LVPARLCTNPRADYKRRDVTRKHKKRSRKWERKFSKLGGKSSRKMRRSNGYYFYTLEVVVSKVESPTVCFELKTMILFRMSMWPAVYDEGPPEGASTSLRYDDLALPDPTTVAFLRSWSRMVIMQKEIPRMGLVCIVRVINCE
jgi:hypothetical protein